MKYVNKVILLGNLTADPESKAAGERPLTTFVVATNRVWKNAQAEPQSLAEYHNIACWGGLADHVLAILKKSKLVYVEGYLKTRSWEDNGIKHFRTEIVADNVIALDKKPEVEDDIGNPAGELA